MSVWKLLYTMNKYLKNEDLETNKLPSIDSALNDLKRFDTP